ncbi:unnamed protein product [Phyllotreta striolata]|uniref:Protein kinase domain-containing protein n=1 Tax=Phyllotreta striolata TaxID=444603 RepID=A0A9N9TT79_PHYSR|nr:unnamed protein product [Phyllotreta striolata]
MLIKFKLKQENMDGFKTPLKNKKLLNSTIRIPPSPQMKKIGFGSGIAVYEFERSPGKSRSPWAVKKMIKSRRGQDFSSEINERLLSEAEVLRKLDHPNIIGFRASFKDKNGLSVLAMEECTSSLGDLIERRLDELGETPFPAETILKVSIDTAKGLYYLHNEALLLHCDIKSYNILVKGDFEVCKLCDFGVCLPLTALGELDSSKVDEEIEYAGTNCWSAPEVLSSQQEITTKADIYSFGLVIWEMIALNVPNAPFNDSESFNDDLENSIDDILVNSNRQRPALPDVDLGPEYNIILEIFFCCTIFEKNKRPTAADLVAVLSEISEKN